MRKRTQWVAMLLAMVMIFSLMGCDKNKSSKKESSQTGETEKADVTPYIGSWQGSDHDGENIVHYLVVDENGYWNIYMNYATLKTAIKQLPDRYVSFRVTFMIEEARNNSDHTGCFYEYREYDADEFSFNEDGKMVSKSMANVVFEEFSKNTGDPEKTIVEQAQDLFVSAQSDADKELKEK